VTSSGRLKTTDSGAPSIDTPTTSLIRDSEAVLMEPAAQRYRIDIDYLRALAVLAVIGFHFGVPGFSGGFVGVDVFFVISGYLIGSHVVAEVRAGTFSFARFYERRIRRILPALYAMLAIVGIIGWFMFRTSVYVDFFRSLISTVLFGSNFFFWNEVGYFDAAPGDKVLLHTWSLAVEEQFYLIFPVLLILAYRLRVQLARFSVRSPLLMLAVASAALCGVGEWAVLHAPMSAFYLTPYRAWEFLIGTALVWSGPWWPRRRSTRILTISLGLVLMLGAIVLFNEAIPFPGLTALIPCAGAAFYLHASGAATDTEENPWIGIVPAFLGKISYSLYLWHWPVLILGFRLVDPSHRGTLFIAAMSAAVLVMATLSYLLVEQPVRRRFVFATRHALIVAAAVSSLVLLAAGLAGSFVGGFPHLIARPAENVVYSPQNIGPFYRMGTCFLEPNQPFSEYRKDVCLKSNPSKINVLLAGDSTAAHYFLGFAAELGPKFNLMQMTVSSCAPFFGSKQPVIRGCDGMIADLRTLMKTHPPDVLIVSANWRVSAENLEINLIAPDDYRAVTTGSANEFEWSLHALLSELKTDGVPTILFGPSVEFTEPLPTILLRQGSANAIDQREVLRGNIFAIDRDMRRIAAHYNNVTFVSVLDTLCPAMHCPLETESGEPLTWDPIHLTPAGSLLAAGLLFPSVRDVLVKHHVGQ
jgi:peptidoglycan/LPS O-acetylase OafA/YrhL